MAADSRTCPSCGARVPDEVDRCELCGTPLKDASEEPNASEMDPEEGTEQTSDGEPTPGGEADTTDQSVFCNQCGWENPPGAQYCSQCGTELQDLSTASPASTRPVAADLPEGDETDSTSVSDNGDGGGEEAIGRQIVLVVGGAFLMILGLFFLTQWSAQYNWSEGSSSGSSSVQAEQGGASSGGGGQRPMGSSQGRSNRELPDLRTLLDQTADSLSGSMSAQIDSLQTRVEQASGGEKRKLQAELVNLLIGAGHPDRAALVQKDIAEATGTVDARRRAADLLYRWMQKLQSQGQRKQIFKVAHHAAEAYAAVVEQRPDDLDARTRMGEAYLLTNEPMRGIQAINAVLKDDSTFVPARFQKGLALLQINRLDRAIRQFERVKQYAEEGSPFYRQADRALTVINKRRQGAASGNASTQSSPNP